MKKIPVLIVGGGPVGLSMALALARQNVESMLVEKNPKTTLHPRARGVNVRTMELFKIWGNDDELLQFEQPKEARRFIWAKSLKGDEVARISLDDSETRQFSPVQSSYVSQDHVENSLYHSLLNQPLAQVCFSKKMVDFKQDNDGVLVTLLDVKSHQIETVKAQYMIAADGANSGIRKELGIAMIGTHNLGQFCSVYCEIDLDAWTSFRPSIGFFFSDPKLSDRFLASIDGKKRWIVGLRFKEKQVKGDFIHEYCLAEIRSLLGMPDIDIKIINKCCWTMGAQNAEKYHQDRVFLVGDAAHRLPPTGGFGMNTGIQDAHNLAWKLAFVLNHGASTRLLDSYFEERAPVAEQNIEWSMENAARYSEISKAISSENDEDLKKLLDEQHENLNYTGLDLGFLYHSKAIFSETDETLSTSPSIYLPTTSPGSRFPHVLLKKKGKEFSSLDLFEKDFVLITASDQSTWKIAAEELSENLAFPLKIYSNANPDFLIPSNVWYGSLNMSIDGAILVRPDGHVAWRSNAAPENPKTILKKVFGGVTCSIPRLSND